MFRRGDEDALLHQAGGVADFGDVTADGLNLKTIKIGTAKNNTGARGRRNDVKSDGSAAVQAYAVAGGLGTDCLFVGRK